MRSRDRPSLVFSQLASISGRCFLRSSLTFTVHWRGFPGGYTLETWVISERFALEQSPAGTRRLRL